MRFWLMLALCLAVGTARAASVYEGIEAHFEKAGQPELKDLKGYVSGRCVEPQMPDTLLPAVLLTRSVSDESVFPPIRTSFSYYGEKGKADLFDGMTTAQIEKHPGAASWMKQEQWQKIVEVDGSLVTHFAMAGGMKFTRALRQLEETDATYLILKVSRLQGSHSIAMRYCYFHKALTDDGSQPPPEEPGQPIPEGADYLIGETQGAHGMFLSLINQEPTRIFRKLRIVNYGRRIVLRDFQVVLTNGLSSSPVPVMLPENGTAIIDVHPYPTFQLTSVRFLVDGETPNVRVWGVSNPGERATDTLVLP